ncbi:hypothetical protein E4479_24895 [Shigella flexneri]|uniref:hypothetical protein n=1 Tax=Shigella boydii TaxID=621 RepID=UPI00020A5585|nr:hypothetical protein [Shigella boydii]EFW9297282.1 hypothetical protein [Shigella flexneri]EGI91243.1 hypothetical protein SB521682_3796 [Shigella boydii 5216-82]EGI95962.1 hypothetical protein SB521682_1876 [Shigella boydii 5216-82]EGO9722019.1 hypothetical protein [Escherichia coli]
MKPAIICILCENTVTGDQYRIRERHINPDRSLLDNITGPDDERVICLNDGTQLRVRNIRREITLEPTLFTREKKPESDS